MTTKERFDVVERVVTTLASRNKLNLMLYDGELLYVHKNMPGTFYHSRPAPRRLIFSTAPLSKGTWDPFPLTRLEAFWDGEKVFEGKPHPYVFVPTLPYIAPMDAMHI